MMEMNWNVKPAADTRPLPTAAVAWHSPIQ